MSAFNSSFHWVDTATDLAIACLELSRHSVIGVDTETAYWAMGREYEKLALIQIAYFVEDEAKLGKEKPQTRVFIIDAMKEGLPLEPLRSIMESPNILKLAHNASFDCRVLNQHASVKMAPVWCTMRAEKRVNHKISASLATLAQRHFDLELDKQDQMSRWEHRPLSNQEKFYAAKDAVLCLWLYLHQKERKLNGMYSHFAVEQAALPFESGELFVSDQDRYLLHTWLKDWIARGGPREYRDQTIWLHSHPPYCISDMEAEAALLEARMSAIGEHKKPEEPTSSCTPDLSDEFWTDVLHELHARVVSGDCPGLCADLETRSKRVAIESKERLKTAEREDKDEREQIKYLADAAEMVARYATVIPYAPVKPDYTEVFNLADKINRLDLARKYRRARYTH